MRTKLTAYLSFFVLLFSTGCHELFDLLHEFKSEESEVKVKEYASGLLTPFGLELDYQGNVWVAEAGTGNNDGRISMITSQNQVYPVIEGFTSIIPPDEPSPIGVSHLILVGPTLWFLNIAEGRLYHVDISSFYPGDEPMQASEIESEDIATFVLNCDLGDADTEESNPYNLILGPDGNIYIVDAAANAIVKREAETGELSIFAIFPDIINPTEIGPPLVNSVPTGIVYDGAYFLVSTLTGFPFVENEALIYQVDMDGNVSVYQGGFTTLVDITLDADAFPVVVQYALFEQGFAPSTGKVSGIDEVMLDEINYPLGIRRKGKNTYYVTSSGDGVVHKIRLR